MAPLVQTKTKMDFHISLGFHGLLYQGHYIKHYRLSNTDAIIARSQTVEVIRANLTMLTSRRNLLEYQGGSLENSGACNSTSAPTPMPRILHVKSNQNGQVSTDQRSEVMLKCAGLALMRQVDDPVYVIKSFKTSGFA